MVWLSVFCGSRELPLPCPCQKLFNLEDPQEMYEKVGKALKVMGIHSMATLMKA